MTKFHLGMPIEHRWLIGPESADLALQTTARAHQIMRILGVATDQRAAFLAWLETTVTPVEAATPLIGGVWRWCDVVAELERSGQQYLPQAAAVP